MLLFRSVNLLWFDWLGWGDLQRTPIMIMIHIKR